jgi:general secretion pathway protein L
MNAALSELVGTPQRLLHWWLAELVELTPAWLRQRLAISDDRIVLYVSDAETVVLRQTADGLTALGRLTTSDEEEPYGSLRELLHSLGGGDRPRDICIRLDPGKAVRRHVLLPLVAEENLREVIGFELDRLTPFSPDEVYFSAAIIERDSASQQLKAEVMIVPRALALPALIAARAYGFEPTRIDVADAPGSYGAGSANLLPPLPARRSGSKTLLLAAVAVILAMIAAYLPIERMQETREALTHRYSEIKATAAAAALLQREIDGLNAQQTLLVDLKRERPLALQVLFEITHILPDDVYLTGWSLAGSEIQIEGTAQSASAVVGLLEQSHLFQNTTFRSPVTQIPGSMRERFRIATKVVEGGPQ